jgi:hypothetical protein
MAGTERYRTKTVAADGTPILMEYEPESDILEIVFGENESATGIELTDHIILRLNQETKRALSLTVLHFSILTEKTEYGPRSYSLDRLNELPQELRDLVLHLATSSPVNQFLKLSHFQSSPTERILFVYVEARPMAAAYA